MERTFVMAKPDAVQRGLCGEIVKRLEDKGFKPVAMKFMLIDESLAREHYKEHEGKGFFGELLEYIISGPVLAMVWEGPSVISSIRNLMGKTDPREAAPGTIRGDLGVSLSQNIIHGSDSPASASREIALFFKEGEILDYPRILDKWIF